MGSEGKTCGIYHYSPWVTKLEMAIARGYRSIYGNNKHEF
jgi:hypothetical protein